MTQNERLRELLKEAREFVECFDDAGEHSLDSIASFKVDRPKDGYPRQLAVCAAADTIARIDAALAEPAEVHPSSLTDVVTLLENERDEARDEVERLTSVIEGLRWDREMACQGCGK